MTYGDLAGSTENMPVYTADKEYVGYIVPNDDPEETRFKVMLGQPAQPGQRNISYGITLEDANGRTVEISGSVEFEIEMDVAASFTWTGLKSFKFIPKVTTYEDLSIDASVVGIGGEWDKDLVDFNFPSITIWIGPVPVVLSFKIETELVLSANAGASISTGIELEQGMSVGMVYDRDASPRYRWVNEARLTSSFNPPTFTASADARAEIEVEPKMLIYELTGPDFEISPYLNIETTDQNRECRGGIDLAVDSGIEGAFEWEINTDNPIGSFLRMDGGDIEARLVLFDKAFFDTKYYNFGGDCDLSPGILRYSGGLFTAGLKQGQTLRHSQTYVLRNDGDFPLNWAFGERTGGRLTASPSSGTLAAGGSTSVTVTFDLSGKSPGVHIPFGWFTRQVALGIPSQILPLAGAVNIAPPDLIAPTLDSPALEGATTAALGWTYTDAASRKYVRGYQVWRSTGNSDEYELAATVTGNTTSVNVPDLADDTTHNFRVVAYGENNNQSQASNVESLSIPAQANTPPQAAITGVPLVCAEGSTFDYSVAATDDSRITYASFVVRNSSGTKEYESSQSYNAASCTFVGTVDLTGYAEGVYTYSATVVDDAGLSVTTVRKFTIKADGAPVITVTAPSGVTLRAGQQVTINWTSENIPATDKVRISVRRDSSGYLSQPDGRNWYRFTSAGADPYNDGTETVTLPTSLVNGASDWRFYVARDTGDAAYSPSAQTVTINAASAVPDYAVSEYFPLKGTWKTTVGSYSISGSGNEWVMRSTTLPDGSYAYFTVTDTTVEVEGFSNPDFLPIRWSAAPPTLLTHPFEVNTRWRETVNVNGGNVIIRCNYVQKDTQHFSFTHAGQDYGLTYANCLMVQMEYTDLTSGKTTLRWAYYAPNRGCVAVRNGEDFLYDGSPEEWWYLIDYTP